jgi:hypothetical protein
MLVASLFMIILGWLIYRRLTRGEQGAGASLDAFTAQG